MDSGTLERRQRTVLVLLIVAAPVLFWGSFDGFGVPKWTLLIAGALALSVLMLQQYLLPGPWRINDRWGLILVGAVVAAALLATGTSDAPLTSFVGAYSFHQGLSTFLALAIIVVTVLSMREHFAETFLLAMAVAAALVAAITAGQLLGISPVDLDTRDFGTVPTTLGNTNFGAAYLGLALPAALYQVLAPSRPPFARQLGALLSVVIIVEVVILGSVQGPLTALAAGGAFLALWSIQRCGIGRTLRGLSVVAVPAIVAVVVFREPIWNELLTSARAGRYGAWVSAWRMFRNNPVLGVGLDRYESLFPAYQPAYSAVNEQFTNAGQAHNVVLDLMADGGLILGGLYVAMIAYTAYQAVRAVRAAYRADDRQRYIVLIAVLSVWIGYQVQSLVSIDLVPLALAHWLVTGVILRLSAAELGLPAVRIPPPRTSRATRQVASVATALVALVVLGFAVIPLRADLAAGEARRLLESGQPAEAMDKAERATSLMGSRSEYWIQRGLAAQAIHGPERALPFMRRGAELSQGNSRIALILAEYFVAAGDEVAAARWFEEALARDPRNPAVLERAVDFYEEAGKPEVAQILRQRRESAVRAAGL